MVADDQRGQFTVAMICVATLFFLVLLGLLIPPPIYVLSAWRSNLPGLIFGSFFLLLGSIVFVRRRRWQRVNQRRQAAARGTPAGVPLAASQPVPNEEALPLPWVIRLKPHWFKHFAFFCFLTGWLMLLDLGIKFLLEGASFWLGLPSALWFLIAGELALLLLMLARVLSPQQIEVSLEDLTVQGAIFDIPFSSRKRTIRWNEARLFAIRGGGKAGTPGVCYELSDPMIVVQWSRLRPKQWWALDCPQSSFEEYERQMEALLALIVAKTNIPLYDVR